MLSETKLTTSIVVITKDRPHLIGGLFEALTQQTLRPTKL